MGIGVSHVKGGVSFVIEWKTSEAEFHLSWNGVSFVRWSRKSFVSGENFIKLEFTCSVFLNLRTFWASNLNLGEYLSSTTYQGKRSLMHVLQENKYAPLSSFHSSYSPLGLYKVIFVLQLNLFDKSFHRFSNQKFDILRVMLFFLLVSCTTRFVCLVS